MLVYTVYYAALTNSTILDEENAAAAYYGNEEDYRTFHYLGNHMKVKRKQAEAA
jgi:hypothetical protein